MGEFSGSISMARISPSPRLPDQFITLVGSGKSFLRVFTWSNNIKWQNTGLIVEKFNSKLLFKSILLFTRSDAVITYQSRLTSYFPCLSAHANVYHIQAARFWAVLVDTLVKLD